jgi:bacillithiol biosynthesis cysteine-adding enzyme BshC
LLTADCFPITVAPGLHRLYLDYLQADPAVSRFYRSLPPDAGWQTRPEVPAHWPELVSLLAGQNPGATIAGSATRAAIESLRQGAGVVVTGQQVGLFGGPLFTPFKAATAIARARQANRSGSPHAAIFWLASEDHDFEEINHVQFPSGRDLKKLVYQDSATLERPVGGIQLDERILPLVDEAWALLGGSDAIDALVAAYQPGRTFAQAFGDFYSSVFAAQGLLVLDASGGAVHRIGAPVLRAAIEQADELHQKLIGAQNSLVFRLDDKTGARMALKRQAKSAAEPDGTWQAGRQRISTAELLGILDSQPERLSPSALLRPVFQDFLLSTSLIIGGPAEIAYFAQSAVLFEQILGRLTPAQPRFSGTLVEPAIGQLLAKHELGLERVFGLARGAANDAHQGASAASLAQLLAARALPIEGKQKLAATDNALNAELTPLLEWMTALDAGLGSSARTAAAKMRYQMNRLHRLAANFELEKEASLGRHAEAISYALYPGGVLQERVHGAAYYFARYGFGLAEEICLQAENACLGHSVMRL